MVYTMTQMSQDLDQCIKDCLDCYKTCITTMSHCLEKGGKHAEAKHIVLLKDCADICRTSAEFMLRNSGKSERICLICSDICMECATSCDRLADDDQMRECANICRRCADSCRRMAETAAQHV